MSKIIKKLTVVILTKNSADDLKELLPQLKWAGKILIIDDNSQDKTASIAKKYGARIIKRALNNDWASQRNTALEEAKTVWTLFIDSDERPSPDLPNEIRKALWRPGKTKGFKIFRHDVIKNKILKFGEVKDYSSVRLGKTKTGKWIRSVHEYWDIEPTETLKSPFYHHSHKKFSDSLKKIKTYSKADALYRLNNSLAWSPIEIISHPIGKFLYTYFFKLGILDGWSGLYMSSLMSIHSFLVRYHLISQSINQETKRPWSKRLLRIGTMSVLLAYPLGHLLRIQINQVVAIYVFEIIIAIIILIWMIDAYLQKKLPSLPNYTLGLGLFSFSLGLSLVMNFTTLGSELLSSSLYWFRWMLYSLFFLILWDAKKSNWLKIKTKKTLINLGSITLIIGWIQYLIMPDMRWIFWFGWDDHFYRMIGLLFDPGYLSLIIVLLIFTLAPNWKKHKILLLFALLGLGLTYARSGFIVFALCLIIYGLMSKKIIKSGALFLVFIGWVLIINSLIQPGGEGVNLSRTYSVLQRARSVFTGLDIFRENPIFGVGYNAYPVYTQDLVSESHLPIHPSSPDSSIVLVMATAGIVGLSAFIFMTGQFLYTARKKPWVFTSICAILLHSMTNNSFFYPWVMLWLAILLTHATKQNPRSNFPAT